MLTAQNQSGVYDPPTRRAIVVFGTRPEAIKLAPVVRALRLRPNVALTVCSTGQHRELLAGTLRDLDLQPDIDLGVMRPGQPLSALFGRVLAALDEVIEERAPDTIIVQGDTTSVPSAALAAFHRGVRVAHVEAGLRTDDRQSPFPEEMNRRLAGVLADVHFPPTQSAADALQREGVDPGRILVTGNTGIDSLLHMAESVRRARPADGDDAGSTPLVLVTAHRRENFGDPYSRICRAVTRLARAHADHVFLWPLHHNPQARDTAIEHLQAVENVRLVEALGYADMVRALTRARLVLTDSGGLQEEAPSLGVPVLVLRESTERPEAVTVGAAELVGSDEPRIFERASAAIEAAALRGDERSPRMVYGDGTAAERIVRRLTDPEGFVQPFHPQLGTNRV